MVQQVANNKNSSASEPAFKVGFPACGHGEVFEIKLLKMGDMTSPITMRAQADLSRQYAFEGKQWIACESGAGFLRGETIPSHRVEGWRSSV
jgi:hypothetical protein